jgi:SH3-like domain-containing protein
MGWHIGRRCPRWQVGIVFVFAFTAISAINAALVAEEFPYSATVTKHQAEVRSGPGASYYATDTLATGMTVEVYRHDPGGWCAIRPPEGSFDWVRSRNLDIAEDGLASVNKDNVVARTGSALSNAKDVIQVHLERGEVVELIDGDETNPGSWRKIAPPAGEFRWIAREDIAPEKKSPVARAAAAEPTRTEASAAATNPPAKPIVPAQFTDEPIIDNSVGPIAEDEVLPTPPLSRKLLSRAALNREVVEIDLELSARVAGEESTWQFDDLVARVERAIELAPTALDRATAFDMLNKIERFERLADGGRGAVGDNSLAARLGRAGGASLPGGMDLLDANGPVDPSRYDGVGRLAQVVSKQAGAPQYALVDSTGQVRYYLNPAPGINLRPFLNKQVGVNGTRGAIAARQRQIISAQRVTEIPTAPRRF